MILGRTEAAYNMYADSDLLGAFSSFLKGFLVSCIFHARSAIWCFLQLALRSYFSFLVVYDAFCVAAFFTNGARSLSDTSFHSFPILFPIWATVASGWDFMTLGLSLFAQRKNADIGLFGALGSEGFLLPFPKVCSISMTSSISNFIAILYQQEKYTKKE